MNNITNKFSAKITNLTYKAGSIVKETNIKKYPFVDFDINKSSATGLITFNDGNQISFAKWVTPKRTRSYPFSRLYDIYHFSGKVVVIIPIIKDEGIGKSKNKSNNDRVNFITLSWMNLMNIYVVLAWYDTAEKKSEYRITNQKFNSEYVKSKLEEIKNYKLDAHHWNNKHFTDDFCFVLNKSVEAYKKISLTKNVKLHKLEGHINFLNTIIDKDSKISLTKFAETTLGRSKMAANRESLTNHLLELLAEDSIKGIFEIENNLGGKYYLTADEIFVEKSNGKKVVKIQESKNSSKGKLPGLNDIKDGLFKILLFSQISTLKLDNKPINFDVQLKLTGNLKSEITLPTEIEAINEFAKNNTLKKSELLSLKLLNEESYLNNYAIFIQKH